MVHHLLHGMVQSIIIQEQKMCPPIRPKKVPRLSRETLRMVRSLCKAAKVSKKKDQVLEYIEAIDNICARGLDKGRPASTMSPTQVKVHTSNQGPVRSGPEASETESRE